MYTQSIQVVVEKIKILSTTTSYSSGGASPSTREALEGMLSFSEHCYSTESGDQVKKSPSKLAQQVDYHEEEDDQSIENIDKVHQDEDFSKY